MKGNFSILFSLLIVNLVTPLVNAQQRNDQSTDSHCEILNGQVDFTYIRLYIPKRVYVADKLLRENKTKQATILLKAEAIQHKDDMGAYVEWIQSDRTVWSQEADIQEDHLRLKPNDSHAAFKLSVILLYQWYGRKTSNSSLERARFLMRKVWDQSHSTLAGLFLVELASRPSYKSERRWNITEEILAYLLGSQSLREYQEAKQKGWHGSPPSMIDLSGETLRQLYGVVLNFRTLNDYRITRAIYSNGKMVGIKEDITEQQEDDLHSYADIWCKRILRLTDKEWSRTATTLDK